MVIRQRAVHSEDKQERHHAILDAAERLLARAPERVANVAEVADEAGLAKGTVYLYFPSKDELLLAVHERRVDEFFRALYALLAARRHRSGWLRSWRSRAAHDPAVDVPSVRHALLRRRAGGGIARNRAGVQGADGRASRHRRRRTRAPFSRAVARRGHRALAPQLRAHRPAVADVGQCGRAGGRRQRVRSGASTIRASSIGLCARCGTARSDGASRWPTRPLRSSYETPSAVPALALAALLAAGCARHEPPPSRCAR